MQKIIEDREKRKKKWIRIGKISAISLVSIIVLVRILCSSYAFCNWYLPLVSHSLGIRITADEVKFTPFSSKKHLNFRGLQIEIKDKVIFTASSFKTKFSFFDLIFKDRYSLDNVTVEKASLVIYDLRKTDGDEEEGSGLEKVRIGTVAINDLSVRYAPEKSAVYGNAFFDEVHIDSMLPDQINTIQIRSFLAWNMQDSTMMNLPVESHIQFMLDQGLNPVMLKAQIETQKLNGHVYKQDLSGLRLKAFLDCKIDEKSKVTLNRVTFQQFDDERETFSVNALGYYDLTTQCGSLQIEAAADKMSIPLIPTQYSPHDLDLRFSGTLIKKGAELLLTSDLNLDAESISRNGITIIQKPEIRFVSRLMWNIKEENLTISECFLEAFSNKAPILSAKTSENFALTINQDTSWNLAPADSLLQLKFTECPLNLLNTFLPFQFGSGSLDGTYNFHVNAAEESVSGIFKGTAENVELCHNGKLIFRKFPMSFEGKINSATLKNISSFDILSAVITYGEAKSASLNLTGKVHLKTGEIALNGILKTDIQAITDHLEQIDQQKCKKILALFGNCIKQNEHKITLNLFPESKNLEFTIRSTLNELTLPMMKRAIRLKFSCDGQLLQKQEQQQILLKMIQLEAPGDLDFQASADITLPDEIYRGQIRLKKISPDVLRGIWLACEQESDSAANWIRKIYFSNMTASADLWFSGKQQTLKISNVSLKMMHANGGDATLTLKAPISGTLNPCKFNDAPAFVSFTQFPLEYANTLTDDQCSIKILPALINCTVNLTFRNNFKDIPFQTEGVVDQLRCQRKGTIYDFGRCAFRSDAEFKDLFSSLSYNNTTWDLEKQGNKLHITGSGNCQLYKPFTNNMSFAIPELNRAYIASFFPAMSSLVCFSHAEVDTRIQLHCDRDYQLIKLLLDQQIKRLTPVFPEDAPETPPDLNGDLHLDLTYRVPEQILTLNKSFARLKDREGVVRYHVELHGSWDGSKNNRSTCTLLSDAADLKTAHLAYKAVKNTPAQEHSPTVSATEKDTVRTVAEKEKEKVRTVAEKGEEKVKTAAAKEKDTVKAVAVLKSTLERQEEPGAIDFNGFSTKLTVDLKNWTYTEHLTLAMKGIFTVDQNIFHARELAGTINNAPFLLDAYADPGKSDGWILKLLCKVNDLEITPFLNAFGSDDLKSRNITGRIDRLELNVSTKGITYKSLDQNLSCNIKADFSKISCPFIREDDDFASWQIALVPLTLIPRFYDLILPEGPIRETVQNVLGGSHIDVLTGNKNITLDRGTISIQNASARKTDLLVTKFLFSGPVFQVASKDFMFNPFHNSIRAEILTKFAGTTFPIKIKGKLDDPEFELPNILGNALLGPLKRINVFQKEDPVWDFDSPPVTPGK